MTSYGDHPPPSGAHIDAVPRRFPDALATVWLLAITGLYLSPALKDGTEFGPADIGANMSLLTGHSFHGSYYNNLDSDIITQYQPWSIFDWSEVHHGIFPMWNYLVGTGLPQFLNFQSAPLSLSSLVGYAFPVGDSLLVGVAVKLFMASLGVYVAARVMKMSFLPSLFSSTTFMLSGSFSGWLGWSISGPLSWSGWILAGCILAYRKSSHWGPVVLLALSVAFSIYAGFPETSLLLSLGIATVVLATAAAHAYRKALSVRGAARVVIGILAGIGLSAPLLLPGAYVLRASGRATSHQGTGLSINLASLLLARGYYGLPLRGSIAWENYYETTAYVGILAVVFAIIAVWKCRSRAPIVGLAAGAVIAFAVVYHFGRSGPVQWVLDRVGFDQVALQRMLSFLAFCISLLAGFGMDYVLAHWDRRCLRRCVLPAIALVALVTGSLWIAAIRMRLPNNPPLLGSAAAPLSLLRKIRENSLYWPSLEITSLAVWLMLSQRSYRSRRISLSTRMLSGAMILATQAGFLVLSGVGLNTYSHDLYPRNAQIDRITSIVGSRRFGLDAGNIACSSSEVAHGRDCGVRLWLKDGFYPESNVAYDVDELGMHDPVIPQSLIVGWPVADAGQNVHAAITFDPDIDTVALARMYGVSYVLAAPDEAQPVGMVPVWHSAAGTLLRVPAAGIFSAVGDDGGSSIISTRREEDSAYDVRIHASQRLTVDAAITWYPGWSAEIGGKPVKVAETKEGLLQFAVPPGTWTVHLRYWPEGMSTGLGVTLATIGLFGVSIGGVEVRRWRFRKKSGSAVRAERRR